jgi:hypothetical protein
MTKRRSTDQTGNQQYSAAPLVQRSTISDDQLEHILADPRICAGFLKLIAMALEEGEKESEGQPAMSRQD